MIAAPPIVRGANLSKTFGATPALRDVSLEVRPGEIRALVGRNGAGKSTLVSVLAGMLEPDSGTIHFSGEPAPVAKARELWQSRVACVYQHPKIIPTLSCAENLFLCQNMRTPELLSWRKMRREARAVLERWGLQIEVDTPAGGLSIAERQLLEIARAMIQGSRLLILDEPTAKLNAKEIERLFVQISALKSAGVGILFISHHLDEIFEIADSVTVLRDGRKVLDRAIAGLERSELIDAMVGSASTPALRTPSTTTDCSHSQVRLDVRNLSCKGLFDDVSFQVKSCECVGLAGLTGSGKEAIGEVLAGLKNFDSGTIRLDEIELPGGDVAKHNRAGIGFVPQDRHREGLVLALSVAENATMTISDNLGLLGFINPHTLLCRSMSLIDRLGIKTPSPDQPVSSLSGGNQQKVVLARALARDPTVLVLINPTSGVDVASKAALFTSIREVASQGAAVLIISDEIEELDLCDRVLVIRSHRLTREFLPPFSDRDLIAEMEAKMARGVAA
jgi:simple sugar transport system ATP-binding protein